MTRRLRPEEQAAIEWLALQRSGHMNEAERRRFEHWLAASEQHQAAWQGLQRRLSLAFAGLAEQPASLTQTALLSANLSRRHTLRGALAFAGVGLGGFWLTRSGMPLDALVADLSTALGERRRFALADGSNLLLNAESRVDIAQKRHLQLLRGALALEVNPHTQQPFMVESAFGQVQTLGGRFSLAHSEQASTLWVQHAQVQLQNRSGRQLLLKAGEGAQFDHQGCQRLEPQRQHEFTWQDGWLELHDRPLEVLIAALRPYHSGHLRLSATAANLRISGLFSLDNSEQVLASLAEILPLRIQRYLGWWTSIEHS